MKPEQDPASSGRSNAFEPAGGVALRCGCGALRGHVRASPSAIRATCYCRDCQAFACFLGTPGIVDGAGGTQVVAMLPEHVHFTGGLEHLACVSLSERGLLRWYASCCRTPIGNTPRERRVPYAGMINACLGSAQEVESAFGPLRIAVNTKSARSAVSSTPLATMQGVARLMISAARARLGGGYKNNAFFTGDGEPIRPVQVLSTAERERAYSPDP